MATPRDHPDRALFRVNLGQALRTRGIHLRMAADLDEALDISSQAVQEIPEHHPHRAEALWNLGKTVQAKTSHGGRALGLDATAIFAEGMSVLGAPPLTRARCGRACADILTERGQWAEAHQEWQRVLQLLPFLVALDLDRGDRQHHLSLLNGIGPRAASAALRAAGAAHAWSALEQGRGVLLQQALASRQHAVLRGWDQRVTHEADKLRQVLNASPLPTAEPDDDVTLTALTHRRRQAWRDWDRMAAEVRCHPGQEAFAPRRRMADHEAIVAVTATGHYGDALVLTSAGADHVALPDLIEAEAAGRATALLAAAYDSTSEATAVLREVLAWLWDAVTGPVLSHLGHHQTPGRTECWPHLWWIPTGALSALPLHAAGHHTNPDDPQSQAVLDRVVSSYTPTVSILDHVHQLLPTAETRALVVGINQAPDHKRLNAAVAEARAVSAILAPHQAPLMDADATRQAVLAALPGVRWAHFACHAAPAPDPADSHLVLADGPLPVRELSDLDVGMAYVAYLSACSTAFGGTNLIDESIHIASAFQLAGFQHVIGTLWPVADIVSQTMASKIYERLTIGTAPALAVHDVVRWARDEYQECPQAWASHLHFGP